MKSIPDTCPLPVLEAYDAIEKLFIPKQDQPIVESNELKSDVLLFILHSLFDHPVKTKS